MGAAVGLTEDGDRFNSQVTACPNDSQSNLTAVSNQNALKHLLY
jgi:hypothetical protein